MRLPWVKKEPDGLTPRQRTVLHVVRTWYDETGTGCAVRDIRDLTGVNSTSSVHRTVMGLVDRGLLKWATSPRTGKRLVGGIIPER